MTTVFAMLSALFWASPAPQSAQAVTDETPAFGLNQNDLEFILRQIQVSEAHAADVLNPSSYELLCTDQSDAAQDCVSDEARPRGVRTVDGSFNNLRISQETWGSSQEVFPRLLPPEWRQADPVPTGVGWPPNPPGATADCDPGVTCYEQTEGFVYDAEPRVISNLVVDQTTDNPAIVNQIEDGTAQLIPGTNRAFIPNTAADEGLSAPFNSFLGFFGQFFDHGLDLVSKGGNGTLVVPLAEEDPLYCQANGVNGQGQECDPRTNFLVLTRATRHENGPDHINLTTPFIDQNQTYSSNPSHQVFLREYELVGGVPMATGRLLEGTAGGMSTWADVKRQASDILGIELTDAHVLGIPTVHVDLYGNFIPGTNGYPQLVTNSGLLPGTPGGTGTTVPADYINTGQAFLDDIAHGATPVITDGVLEPRFDENGDPVLDENGDPVLTGYDNATLGAHFIAGDGRVNENIGLTAVHAVFHAEHNRLMGEIEEILDGQHPDLIAQDSDARGGIAEFAKAFRGEAHAYVSHKPEDNLPQPQANDWSYEERLFQAAKFANEMQYQHLVFEEFGRKIAPTIDGVVFNENSYDAGRNPAIFAEFAHVVYRFGHSMMTEEIGRQPVIGGDQTLTDVPLLDGFLNPTRFDEGGTLSHAEAAGSLINGMTSITGNQIDEHVVDTLRNNLLGLPLDLPTINMLRARDTGVPPLQSARRTLFDSTGLSALAPYANWEDFGLNIKNGNNFGRAGNKASLVNFVAAYGAHPSVTNATTIEDKRAAAALLVNGSPQGEEFVVRLAGTSRFQTAQAIADRHFTNPVPVAYIAAGMNFPDALAAAPLAAATGGPILMAGNLPGELPLPTVLALQNLNPGRIVVLGGPMAIPQATLAALDTLLDGDAPVTRLAGANRYATAAEIATSFATPGGRVFIASGETFPDALAAAPVAAAEGSAILLVRPNSIPDETAAALRALNPSEIVILGQQLAVSTSVQAQLGAYSTGDVVRVGGASRYDTAMAISSKFFTAGVDRVYVATGGAFPDALTAAPGISMFNSPLLLMPPTGPTPAMIAEIQRLAPGQIYILGGPLAVSPEAEAQLLLMSPEPVTPPPDRVQFMNGTGSWANVDGETVTGLEQVDFWVGGLAERLDPFGGMLGSTFNYIFEMQLENLQFGDRFYYLFRNEGEQLFAALEGNTFSDLIQRNTDASHLPADIFALQDPIIDIAQLDPSNSADYPEGLLREANGTWRWSGDEHVEMHGTTGNDLLRGDEGDDAIWGYAGDDRIEGGSGNDSLVGGPGDDIITDSFGDDNIKGMQGHDYIHSGPGIDLAIGGLGDDFMVNGAGEGTVFFAGMGDDIVTSSGGRFQAVIGGEHDDWVEGGPHADLLQGDNADQFQNDTLGGNDVVAGMLGNDDIEGEGGNDVLIGTGLGTDRHHGGNGFDWLTYYGATGGVTSDWAYNRFFEPNNPLPSRFDFLEALSGGPGNDTLRGPLTEADDLSPSEIELSKMSQEALDLVDGLEEMLRPTIEFNGQLVALGDFTTPMWRDAPEIDMDGVHMVIVGGPGNDNIMGRGGNDYLDGDAMLRVRLMVPGVDGAPDRYWDTALSMQALVGSGQINPGDIEIVRDIVYDTNPSVDTATYEGTFDTYEIAPVGPLGSGYWSVTHVQVDEAEESDGTDIIRGFERLQFADGCAELAEDGMTWESCLPTAEVTLDSDSPAEGAPIAALLWEAGGVGTVPFDTTTVSNVRYTWWTGEGDAPDNITEWEDIVNPLGTGSAIFVPTQAEVGTYVMVTASYTDADGFFRTATSAVAPNPVADVTNDGALPPLNHPTPLILPGTLLAGTPVDGDGLGEDQTFIYQWSWTDTDPTDETTPPVWTDYDPALRLDAQNPGFALNPEDIGRWIRVSVTYTDGGGEVSTVTAHTSASVTDSS